MTTESSDRPGKRSGRAGLLLPFILVLLALGGWSVWWFMVAQRVEQGVDRSAAELRQAGYQVAWSRRSVEGWPFRTFVRFRDFSIQAPSGHALAAPRLEAEANTYALGRWVAAAPQGVVLTRAEKGRVRITGEAIRASLSGLDQTPPRLVLELRKPVFTALPGADPFPLASAQLIDLHVRPGAGSGTGDFLFRVEGGAPRPDGMLDWIGSGQPFSTRWEGSATGLARFSGASWTQAARGWSAGGGILTNVRGRAAAGTASAEAASLRLWAGSDGRLRGSVDLTVTGGPESLLAMGRAQAVDPAGAGAAAAATAVAGGLDGTARIRLDFTAEGAKIGPVRLTGSPRIY